MFIHPSLHMFIHPSLHMFIHPSHVYSQINQFSLLQLTDLMLREIHIDKFNKLVTQYKSEVFASLRLESVKSFSKSLATFVITDEDGISYQLYIATTHLDSELLNNLVFLETSPKIIALTTEAEFIAIEQKIDVTLQQYLDQNEDAGKVMSEQQIKIILQDLKQSLDDYSKHQITYTCIHPKNIVSLNHKWQLSLTGLLFQSQTQFDSYTKNNQFSISYSLGCLAFQTIFGFAPFQKQTKKTTFSFATYIQDLDKEENQKNLKIYLYASKIFYLSESLKDLIEKSLSNCISFHDFFLHPFFTQIQVLASKESLHQNQEIRMINAFDKSFQSLIMAAISHKQKYPLQKLTKKQTFIHQSKEEISHFLKNHTIFHNIVLPAILQEQEQKMNSDLSKEINLKIDVPYFNREEFDETSDFPCRDLLKLLEKDRTENSKLYGLESDRQANIYLYAYPYAMVFELSKVASSQPPQVINQINKAIFYLLQISALNRPLHFGPLHDKPVEVESFLAIKLKFRQIIHSLYQHFLKESMLKYNSKSQEISVKLKNKSIGLEFYRLCLKLLECSLLIRKEGKDLDLQRIETSQRKQIENDLSTLLKQYFPNKIEAS